MARRAGSHCPEQQRDRREEPIDLEPQASDVAKVSVFERVAPFTERRMPRGGSHRQLRTGLPAE
jgi:hypothetical protein